MVAPLAAGFPTLFGSGRYPRNVPVTGGGGLGPNVRLVLGWQVFLASRREAAVMRNSDTEIFVRIYRGIVNANFIVKVGTRGAPAGADVSDHVPAVYRLSSCDRIP